MLSREMLHFLIICHSHTICIYIHMYHVSFSQVQERWNVAEENVLVTRSVWVIQFKVVAFRKTPDESSVQKEVDQSRVLSPPSVRPSICSTVKTARQLSLLFRHASVSSTYPCQSVSPLVILSNCWSQDRAMLRISCEFSKVYFLKVYFPKVYFPKVYFPKVYFPKVYFPKVYFLKVCSPKVYSKFIFPKCIFAICTRLACLLSFASLLYFHLQIQNVHIIAWYHQRWKQIILTL